MINKKYELYTVVACHLAHKITPNLQRIYLDIDLEEHRMALTAYYNDTPSELELELLDDIETNSNAPYTRFLYYVRS